MPVTFFAHQAPAVALKMWKPTWVDATAMCAGTMAPDLLYAVSHGANIDPHRWLPALTLGLPLAIAIALLIRWAIASELVPLLPDLGPFRLRSYAVIASRRPAAIQTVASAGLGIASHLAIDGFTHPGRFGPNAFGYDDVSVSVGGLTRPLAGAFQWVGHLGGSVLAAGLLLSIGHRRLLDRWYGPECVERARAARPSARRRVVALAGLVAGALIGVQWGWNAERIETIQRGALGCFLGLAVTAVALRIHRTLCARSSARGDATGPAVASAVALAITMLLLFTTSHLLAATGPGYTWIATDGVVAAVLGALVVIGLLGWAAVRRSWLAASVAIVPALAVGLLFSTASNLDTWHWNESREELRAAASSESLSCTDDRPCMTGTYAFDRRERLDAATLFWAVSDSWCYGGRVLVVPTDPAVFDIDALVELFERDEANGYFVSASTWRADIVSLCLSS